VQFASRHSALRLRKDDQTTTRTSGQLTVHNSNSGGETCRMITRIPASPRKDGLRTWAILYRRPNPWPTSPTVFRPFSFPRLWPHARIYGNLLVNRPCYYDLFYSRGTSMSHFLCRPVAKYRDKERGHLRRCYQQVSECPRYSTLKKNRSIQLLAHLRALHEYNLYFLSETRDFLFKLRYFVDVIERKQYLCFRFNINDRIRTIVRYSRLF